jgi:hypothetical protein
LASCGRVSMAALSGSHRGKVKQFPEGVEQLRFWRRITSNSLQNSSHTPKPSFKDLLYF